MSCPFFENQVWNVPLIGGVIYASRVDDVRYVMSHADDFVRICSTELSEPLSTLLNLLKSHMDTLTQGLSERQGAYHSVILDDDKRAMECLNMLRTCSVANGISPQQQIHLQQLLRSSRFDEARTYILSAFVWSLLYPAGISEVCCQHVVDRIEVAGVTNFSSSVISEELSVMQPKVPPVEWAFGVNSLLHFLAQVQPMMESTTPHYWRYHPLSLTSLRIARVRNKLPVSGTLVEPNTIVILALGACTTETGDKAFYLGANPRPCPMAKFFESILHCVDQARSN